MEDKNKILCGLLGIEIIDFYEPNNTIKLLQALNTGFEGIYLSSYGQALGEFMDVQDEIISRTIMLLKEHNLTGFLPDGMEEEYSEYLDMLGYGNEDHFDCFKRMCREMDWKGKA